MHEERRTAITSCADEYDAKAARQKCNSEVQPPKNAQPACRERGPQSGPPSDGLVQGSGEAGGQVIFGNSFMLGNTLTEEECASPTHTFAQDDNRSYTCAQDDSHAKRDVPSAITSVLIASGKAGSTVGQRWQGTG